VKWTFLCLPVCLAVTLPGCRPKDALNIVGVDRSGSTIAIRQEQQGWLLWVFRNAQDRSQQLAVWAVDRKADCLYGPRKPEDERLPPDVYKALDPGVSKTPTITRPALFWEEMADHYAHSAIPIRIAYLTDGGNDEPRDLARLRTAVSKLAANPKTRIAIIGVQPDQRHWLEAEFKPFGNRLELGGCGEAEAALNGWMADAD
jgi:hypothetical protein